MTPAERDQIAAYLTETREDLLRAMRGLSREQLLYKPAPDRWSVAECLEHIVLVERRVMERVAGALQQPADPAKRSAYEGRDESLVQRIVDRSNRSKAPDIIAPLGRWPHAQLLPEFEAARKSTADFAATSSADLRGHMATHPHFGDLDCYQWLLMIGAHGERHRAQAEEVMASVGFPRAAAAV
jgi:uncharacterized damage-inducible protein DinB